MNEDISKLVGELARLVKILGDKAGIEGVESTNLFEQTTVDDGSSSPYDAKKQKVKTSKSMLSSEDKNRWGIISKIFAKSFLDLEKKENPNFGVISKKDTGNVINVNVEQDEKKSKFWQILGAAVGGLILALGGLAMAIAAFFKGPSAGGKILQMLGTGLMKIGTKILTKIVSIVSKWGSGLLKNLGTGPLAKNLGKIGSSGAFGKIFAKLASGMGKFLLKAIRFLPGVGALVSFWFAYKNFQAGDWVGGIGELASGILSILTLVPGVGPIAGILGLALDIALIARYATKTEEERVEQSGRFGDMFKRMGSWIAEKFTKYADRLPVIGTFIHMYRAYKHLKDGNVSEGIDSLIDSIFPFVPDLSGKVKSGWNFLKSLFNSKDETGESISSKIIDFGATAKEWIKSKLSNLPYFLRKPLEWFGFISKTPDGPILTGLKQSAQEVGNNIKKFFSPLDGVGEKIKNAIPNWDTISDSILSGLSVVKDAAKSASNYIGEKATAIKEGVGRAFSNAFENITAGAKIISEKAKEIGSKYAPVIGKIALRVFDLGKKILNRVTDFSSKVVNKIINVIDKIASIPTTIIDRLSVVAEKIIQNMADSFTKIVEIPTNIINSFSVVSEKIIQNIKDVVSSIKITSEINYNFPEKIKSSFENLDLNVSNNLAAMESLSERSIDILSKLLQVNIKHTEILQQIRQAIVSMPQGNSQPGIVPLGNSPGGGNSVIPRSEPLDSIFFTDIANNDLTYSPSNV